jgi:hypothetical protein
MGRAVAADGSQPYLERVDALLANFEFSKSASRADVAARLGTQAWIAQEAAAGRDVIIPDRILAKLDKFIHWKELTAGEIGDLRQAVESIAHQAELKLTIVDGNKRASFATPRPELGALREFEPTPKPTRPRRPRRPARRNWRLGLRNLAAVAKKVEELARQLDRGDINGPWTASSGTRSTTRRCAGRRASPSSPTDRRSRTMPAADQPPLAGDALLGQRPVLRPRCRARGGAESGQRENRRKLVEGWQTSVGVAASRPGPRTPGEFLSHLTKADAELVQTIWNRLESSWPEMRRAREAADRARAAEGGSDAAAFRTADGHDVDAGAATTR